MGHTSPARTTGCVAPQYGQDGISLKREFAPCRTAGFCRAPPNRLLKSPGGAAPLIVYAPPGVLGRRSQFGECYHKPFPKPMGPVQDAPEDLTILSKSSRIPLSCLATDTPASTRPDARRGSPAVDGKRARRPKGAGHQKRIARHHASVVARTAQSCRAAHRPRQTRVGSPEFTCRVLQLTIAMWFFMA